MPLRAGFLSSAQLRRQGNTCDRSARKLTFDCFCLYLRTTKSARGAPNLGCARHNQSADRNASNVSSGWKRGNRRALVAVSRAPVLWSSDRPGCTCGWCPSCDFDFGLKKAHRRGVANDVRRNSLAFERGAGWQGSSYSLLKDVGGPVGVVFWPQ